MVNTPQMIVAVAGIVVGFGLGLNMGSSMKQCKPSMPATSLQALHDTQDMVQQLLRAQKQSTMQAPPPPPPACPACNCPENKCPDCTLTCPECESKADAPKQTQPESAGGLYT